MNFNDHSNLKGCHAIFGASKYHWINYSVEKMKQIKNTQFRTALGTELHDFAATQIMLGHKPGSTKNIKTNFETFLFMKYYDDRFADISEKGKRLLINIRFLPKDVFETVKLYINDAIGYQMAPETTLVCSEDFYGTADALSFRNNKLRIHDLKTGDVPAHMEQLLIYAAYFCIEYNVKPGTIEIELRIYQHNEILYHNPTAEDIVPIMDKIITFNKFNQEG